MTETPVLSPDQQRYSRILAAGTHAGLAILVILFGLYMFGIVAPQVPHASLPELWRLPAGEFLALAGIADGWGWTAHVAHGDVLTLVGIATLAFCSVPCLIAVMPIYWASGQRALFGICALEVAVILMAASGLIGAAH